MNPPKLQKLAVLSATIIATTIDYSVAHMFLDGTIRVMPGTAIAVRNDWAPWLAQWAYYGWSVVGFHLGQNSSFASIALPNRPNTFTTARNVEEGPFTFGFNIAFLSDFEGDPEIDAPPDMSFRFSEFSLPPGDARTRSKVLFVQASEPAV